MLYRNEGPTDRVIRILVGLVLVPLGLFLLGGLEGSIGGLVAAGVGIVALVTGATGFCLLYVPFGFSTAGKRKATPSFR